MLDIIDEERPRLPGGWPVPYRQAGQSESGSSREPEENKDISTIPTRLEDELKEARGDIEKLKREHNIYDETAGRLVTRLQRKILSLRNALAKSRAAEETEIRRNKESSELMQQLIQDIFQSKADHQLQLKARRSTAATGVSSTTQTTPTIETHKRETESLRVELEAANRKLSSELSITRMYAKHNEGLQNLVQTQQGEYKSTINDWKQLSNTLRCENKTLEAQLHEASMEQETAAEATLQLNSKLDELKSEVASLTDANRLLTEQLTKEQESNQTTRGLINIVKDVEARVTQVDQLQLDMTWAKRQLAKLSDGKEVDDEQSSQGIRNPILTPATTASSSDNSHVQLNSSATSAAPIQPPSGQDAATVTLKGQLAEQKRKNFDLEEELQQARRTIATLDGFYPLTRVRARKDMDFPRQELLPSPAAGLSSTSRLPNTPSNGGVHTNTDIPDLDLPPSASLPQTRGHRCMHSPSADVPREALRPRAARPPSPGLDAALWGRPPRNLRNSDAVLRARSRWTWRDNSETYFRGLYSVDDTEDEVPRESFERDGAEGAEDSRRGGYWSF
ncbi:hypothetical protein M426DRAFT_15892 [Hypoxylon sp. CI-4A]|nr:hypothetical protein M426DRAFT_15892 [Hypoxylon sp. CI-4A]